MIPRLLSGRTRHVSSRTLFGAAALGGVSQDAANRTLDLILDNVAIQTIKGMCKGAWGDKPQTRSCWYEPFEDDDEIVCLAVRLSWCTPLMGSS